MEKEKEIKLIVDTLEGNDEAFRELVLSYQKAVYAMGISYLRNEALAKEVVQETFIIAYRNLPHLKDLNSFGSWLKEIATRVCLTYIEKEKKEYSEIIKEKIVKFIKDSFQTVPPYSLNEIMDCIDNLPERYRLPVVLKYLEGMSYEEIGRFTGETPIEIKGIIQRATKLLRDMLIKEEGSSDEWQDVQK